MWYQDAIIYAVDVEKFADSDGDGVGDFKGLTAKLPYLRSLGVTCVWLLPFFDTPDRDNGYDIRDYYRVNPRTGTLEDFVEFIQRSGEQGMRVIADLVVNHTSNEHPWFEAARRDERSCFRNYYIWAEVPPRLDPDDENIFPGEEDSVWTYDEVAHAYYFHRFYDFQPDLNIRNDQVRAEILKIVDYWVSLGVYGFRVDAAPIMIGENGLARSAPEDPHGPLREINHHLTQRHADGLLLGEANVKPEEISRFFGSGNQLGLLFNFLLNAYLYLAFAREDATPINQALALLPLPPETCGWANFVRTLDELDLSRLSADERQETYKVFAPDPGMRLYDRGIRRRLAPMFSNDKRRLELAYSLLFGLPGSPAMIYGDEIGLGEDLSQQARNAVRVPMQWSAARNAGFSSAPAKDLIQPVVKDGPFSYRKVNVEMQDADPKSLLNRIRHFAKLRREHPQIGRAPLQPIATGNPAVFGHRVQHEGGGLIMLHNLSRKAQSVNLETGLMGAGALRDIIGDSTHKIAGGKAKIKLAAYGSIWGRVEPEI